jgi:hypothetical protein
MPGERAYGEWFTQAIQDGRKKPEEVFVTGPFGPPDAEVKAALRDLESGSLRRTRAAMLRLNTRCIEISRLPPEDQRSSVEATEATVQQLPKAVQLCWSAFKTTALAHRRHHADLRCAAVAIAVERFRQKHQRWPADLSELVPDFLGKIPLDACDGQPVRYKRLGDSVVIYSVGPDGNDNGGNLDRDATKPGTDRGMRLWDVPQRRQPPRGGR